MPLEFSAGAIIFRKNKEIKYLLLQYRQGHWDFPRGHIEKGEKIIDTVKREIEEETGIKDLKFFPNFKKITSWFYRRERKTFFKKAYFLLAETKRKRIQLSPEHLAYRWLNFNKAINILTFKNAQKILKEAHHFLVKSYASKSFEKGDNRSSRKKRN